MEDRLSAKHLTLHDARIGYLDLCGTKAVYETLDVNEQLDRIYQAVSCAWTELSNFFCGDEQSLYVHMFADSLVIAQKDKNVPKDCVNKLVDYFLTVQLQMLRDTYSSKMPILSRCLVKKGSYYGVLFEQLGSKIDNIFFNLSLVGGPTIVKMDRLLKGLPVGVYLDQSLAGEYQDSTRLVRVEGDQLRFVKPHEGFLFMDELFGGKDFDKWVEEMIDRSDSENEFKNKLKPWADAIQNRSASIQRSSSAAEKAA